MSGNVKKAVAVCDYCKTEKDTSQIYSGRKHFAGLKIVDILKIITKLEIPTNTPIKLCTMCISTLHATSGVIERAGEMINHLVPLPKNQAGVANKTNIEINDKPIQVPSDSEPEEPDEPTRQEIFNSPSKNMAATNGTSTVFKKQLDKSPKKQLFSTGGPSKLNESLKHVIKLTPATPADGAANKSTAFSQLFGNSVNHISDSDGSSDEEEEATKGPEEKRNIATNFECKLCDFKSVYPNPMKIHMKTIHDQKRPRIYDCTKCHKCFGLLKTLKVHLLTHGMVEEKEKENKEKEKGAPDVTLARLTALNPKPKGLKNGELTFAVQDTNSSTPKPGEPLKVKPVSINSFKCDICHEDIKGIKAFQKHMTIVHNIEKPKIFKCPECESEFMHKSTMGKHIKMKHGEGAKLNVPRRRKTIDERALLGNMEGGEKIKKPAKIAARRKTVDVSIALAGMSQAKNKKLPQVLDEMNSDDVTPQKPKKSTQQLITESLKSSPKIAKLSDNNNKENAANLQNGTAIEEAATTSKKNVSKKDIDVIDTSQITPLNTESPKKKAKKDGEVLASPALSVGTPKKTKPKKDKDGFATPQNTPIATPNKVKRKKDALDTSQLLINNGNESTSETPKKSNKRKHKLSESSPKLVIDEDYEEETTKQSPLKKSKQEEFIDDDIILFEEVNSNPLPHRREMLESMSQDSIDTSSALSCSQCNKVVSTRKRLDSHIRKKHSGHLKCRECSQSFTQSNDFVGHFANCVAFERLACGVQNCDKVFAAANFLSAHLKKKHKFN